jgi:hypothetical protein
MPTEDALHSVCCFAVPRGTYHIQQPGWWMCGSGLRHGLFMLSGPKEKASAAVSTFSHEHPEHRPHSGQVARPLIPFIAAATSRCDWTQTKVGMKCLRKASFSKPICLVCTFSHSFSPLGFFDSYDPATTVRAWSKFCRNPEHAPPHAERLSNVGSTIGRSVIAS